MTERFGQIYLIGEYLGKVVSGLREILYREPNRSDQEAVPPTGQALLKQIVTSLFRLGSGQAPNHLRRERLRAERTAEVARATVRHRDGGVDGVDDSPAGRSELIPAPPLLQPCEQHFGRLDQRCRVGEIASRNIGRRSVLRLGDREMMPGIERSADAEAAGNLRGFVRQ